MAVTQGYGQTSAAQGRWGQLLLLFLILLGLSALWIWWDQQKLQLQWLVVSAIIVGMCMFAGWMVNGRADGILIDERNRISLSRLQWVAWFIVLLGGYFAGAVWNVGYMHDWEVKGHFPTMQPDLWALLGIVSASAVASNLIVDKKKAQNGATGQNATAAAPVAALPGQPQQTGSIDRNGDPSEASWADLFLGEEVANRDVVDISRLQKLFVTVLLLITYTRLLWMALGKPDPATGFNMPKVSDPDGNHGFLWLLGISHAAYLAYKATPKSGPNGSAAQGTAPSPALTPPDEGRDGCDLDFKSNPTPDERLPAARGGVG